MLPGELIGEGSDLNVTFHFFINIRATFVTDFKVLTVFGGEFQVSTLQHVIFIFPKILTLNSDFWLYFCITTGQLKLFFKRQKRMRQRFLWVSCPLYLDFVYSVNHCVSTDCSFRPKWFNLWAAEMLHWLDKDRFYAILPHTVTFSDFRFFVPFVSFWWGGGANFLISNS